MQRRARKNYLLITFAVAIVLYSTWRLLCLVAWCNPVDGRMVAMPDGKLIPLLDTSREFMALSSALDVCSYESNGKLSCPNVKWKGETVARQMQLSLGRMLRIVDLMSNRYHFDYWLWAGALIGTYRGQRFIPWDQDVDIAMRKKDYEIFVRHAVEDFPSDMFLQVKDSDREHAKVRLFNHAKIRDISTCYGYCPRKGCKFNDGYQVDILVFDNTSNGMMQDSYNRFQLKHSDVFPVKQSLLEGFFFKVPLKTNELLVNNYGDVSRLPPKEKRCTEFIGVPWSSCEGILKMNQSYREHLLFGTMMSDYPQWATYFM